MDKVPAGVYKQSRHCAAPDPAAMPRGRPLEAEPSKDALRKRTERAAAEAADPEFRAKRAAAAKAVRDQKKAERAAGDPDVGGPGARKALADCRERVCKEVGDKLGAFYSSRVKTEEEAQAAAPVLKAAVVEAAEKADCRLKVAKVIAGEALAQRIYEHSRATEAKPISRQTVEDYITRLLFLQKMMTGRDAATIDFTIFRDIERTWSAILNGKAAAGQNKGEPWTLSSKLVYAGALSAVLRRLDGFEKEHAEYSKRYTALHAVYDDQRKDNRMSTAERERFVKWPTLVKLWEAEAAKPSKLTPRGVALAGLYVAIPPRRARDYQLLYLAGPETELTDDRNWLVLSAKGKPSRLVISQYKTSGRYGTWTRDSLPPALSKALAAHIEEDELSEGDPIFPNQSGELYSAGAFSSLIGSVFKKLTGQKAGVNTLRHSIITNYLKTPQRTVRQDETLAKAMSHSTGLQALYNRVDAGSDDEEEAQPAPEALPVRRRILSKSTA